MVGEGRRCRMRLPSAVAASESATKSRRVHRKQDQNAAEGYRTGVQPDRSDTNPTTYRFLGDWSQPSSLTALTVPAYRAALSSSTRISRNVAAIVSSMTPLQSRYTSMPRSVTSGSLT